MTDTSNTSSSAEDRAIDALTRILDSAISPDMLAAQQIILRRLALAGDLFPSRVPAPRNITEIGGYINLIADDLVLTSQVLASTLGVAGPNPSPGFDPVLPPLYLADQPNDRPQSVAAQTPVIIGVRNDFVAGFAAALSVLHDMGCVLPILAASRPLPSHTPTATVPTDLLPFIGRRLELVPGAALVDPSNDPLAVGQSGGTGPTAVVARQVDPTAPNAAAVTASAWSLWSCTSTACTQVTVNDAFVDLGPILAAAGWYTADPVAAPVTSTAPGGWNTWTNVTGLVAGASRFGDELEMLYSTGEISASVVRSALDAVWNGTTFEQAS